MTGSDEKPQNGMKGVNSHCGSTQLQLRTHFQSGQYTKRRQETLRPPSSVEGPRRDVGRLASRWTRLANLEKHGTYLDGYAGAGAPMRGRTRRTLELEGV